MKTSLHGEGKQSTPTRQSTQCPSNNNKQVQEVPAKETPADPKKQDDINDFYENLLKNNLSSTQIENMVMDKIDSEIKQDKVALAGKEGGKQANLDLELSSEIEFRPEEFEVSLMRTGLENESEIDLELGNSKSRRLKQPT